MNRERPLPAEGDAQEVAALIATLHETGLRLEELTAGEVDTVADSDGQTFVLRHAQEQLRHNEAARQAAILDALPTHIALLDANGFIIWANEAWRQFVGANALHSPGHAVGVNYLAVCDHARGAESSESHRVARGIRSVLAHETSSFSIEYSCHSPAEQCWFLMTVTPMADYRASGAVVMHLNITERKRSEDALRAGEQMQRQLADQLETERSRLMEAQRIARIGSWEMDPSTGAAIWSAETHRIFETDASTFSPTLSTFLKHVHPEDRAGVAAALANSAERQTVCTIQHRLLLPNDRTKYVEERWLVAFDEQERASRIVGTCQDITERTSADELVREAPGERTRSQGLRVMIDVAALAAGTMLVYAISAQFSWFDAITRWVGETDAGRWDEMVVAALFLLVGVVVFAFRRLRDSHAALIGYQRVQRALRLLHDDLDRRVNQRTAELASANEILSAEITDRRSAQLNLREANSRFLQMAENINDAFFLRDAVNGQILYVAPAFERIWGRSCESVYANQEVWSEAILPDDRASVVTKYLETQVAGPLEYEYRILRPDGSIRWIETKSFPVRDDAGKTVRIAGISKDITERKQAQVRITYLTRVDALLSGINALIVRVHNRRELFNGACRIAIDAGGFRMSLIGVLDADKQKVVIEASAGKDEALLAAVRDTLSSNELGPRSMVMMAIREKKAIVSNDSCGDRRVLIGDLYGQAGVRSIAVLPLLVASEAVGMFVLYANVTEFFQQEEMKLLSELADNIASAVDHLKKTEQLTYLAYYDALTGLANRTLFLERAAQAMRDRAGGGTLSMVVLDLEHFRQVNDKFGRVAGDALLVWVAQRLTRTLGDASLLARVGADQFALLVPQAGRESDVARFLEATTRALLADSMCIDGSVLRVAAKYGIAQFPEDAVDAEVLFKNAEGALKLAKSSGETFAYFSSDMNARSMQRIDLEEQMRVAVDARQFVLHYQPKVDMISGEIVGAEALIRWQHPDRGLLFPTEFIALAEESGLIVPIGAWVINAVCAQQAAWMGAGLRIVPVAVNLASAQFDKNDLLQTVRAALAAHSLAPGNLELELTESAVMNNSDAATVTLQALRKLGVGLALDDFGTGYSSLSHLKRFPFNSVKIDRSFVTDITRNAEDAAISIAIIAMAHSLGLKVVAEGVETKGQFNYLRTHGCDQMQGHFFSPAVPGEAFESDLLNNRRMFIAPVSADQRTLLLVDDEAGVRSALIRMLRPDGYNILSAGSGAEGLELLALNPVQVIISDQRMPEMTGTEFLDTVRQMYPDTIRLILSGYTDLRVVTESVNRGAVFKFLTKPWEDDVLREHVRDAFRRYRPQRATADTLAQDMRV